MLVRTCRSNFDQLLDDHSYYTIIISNNEIKFYFFYS